MFEEEKPVVDERRRIGPHDIRITHSAAGHWIVSRHPIDQGDPAWPGATFSSRNGTCPDGPDLEAMLDWVRAQPWSRAGHRDHKSPN
jgi:hypothetical protein